jgi:hypothetical protein
MALPPGQAGAGVSIEMTMPPIRLLFLAAAVAVIGLLVLRKSSDDPSYARPLTPDAVDALISSGTASTAELAAVSEAVPSSNDRRPADAPPTPTAPEPSAEPSIAAPHAETAPSSLEVQRALVAELALFEAEWNVLYESLWSLMVAPARSRTTEGSLSGRGPPFLGRRGWPAPVPRARIRSSGSFPIPAARLRDRRHTH